MVVLRDPHAHTRKVALERRPNPLDLLDLIDPVWGNVVWTSGEYNEIAVLTAVTRPFTQHPSLRRAPMALLRFGS